MLATRVEKKQAPTPARLNAGADRIIGPCPNPPHCHH